MKKLRYNTKKKSSTSLYGLNNTPKLQFNNNEMRYLRICGALYTHNCAKY